VKGYVMISLSYLWGLNVGNLYQVVVLKVSLHCKACAGKVKKHLSKMEGELASCDSYFQDLDFIFVQDKVQLKATPFLWIYIPTLAGVKSFDIDFTAKKVTVVGDVTPLGVLNSVSKVKNAQLWGAPPPVIAAWRKKTNGKREENQS
jgi:copper chaperone CopZ